MRCARCPQVNQHTGLCIAVHCRVQEKRKRDMGMQKGGKGNYVEEEKRIARQHGVYGAGFD